MWASYETFASATELHGFDMIMRYKRNRFWAAVWTVLTAAAVCMCVRDAVDLVILYRSEPTAVSVTMKESSINNISLPNPTLCMEVHLDRPMLREFIENYGKKQNPTTFTSLTTAQIQRNLKMDLNEFLLATANAESLDIPTYDQLSLSTYLEYYTYMMLSYIVEGELKYLGYNNSMMVNYDTDYIGAWTGPIDVNATIGFLYYSYMIRKVNLANLIRLVGMSICQKRAEKLTGKKDGVTENLPICKPSMITHLSFSRVCSKLFEDETHQLSDYDSFKLSGTKLTESTFFSTDLVVPKYSFLNSRMVFTWHLDFLGRDMLPIEDRRSILRWNPTVATAFEVFAVAEYQRYNTNFRPCSDAELTDKCDWRQRVAKMQKTCECRPSGVTGVGVVDPSIDVCWLHKPLWTIRNDTVYKTIVTAADYLGFSDSDIPDFSDIVCTPNCRILTLGIDPISPTSIINEGYADPTKPILAVPAGSIEFSVKATGSHAYFEESRTKDFSTFVCDFGGSIGAWLGKLPA